jgi:hypothetical protein
VPARLSGSCQLAVKVPDGKRHDHCFGVIEVQDGKLTFGGFYPQIEPDSRASGAMDTWFSTLIDTDTAGLDLSGDRDLAQAIFSGLHHALFKGEATGSDALSKTLVKGDR